MTGTLDGTRIGTREALHDALSRELALPSWYGRNLDALRDCLTDLSEETELRVLHPAALRRSLGGYADALFRVLADAGADNPRFHPVVEEDSAAPDGPI